jgi:hypothetical protein
MASALAQQVVPGLEDGPPRAGEGLLVSLAGVVWTRHSRLVCARDSRPMGSSRSRAVCARDSRAISAARCRAMGTSDRRAVCTTDSRAMSATRSRVVSAT